MKLTFEQFEFVYNKFVDEMNKAIKEENNRDYEKFGYMFCDLCNEYPDYVLKMHK